MLTGAGATAWLVAAAASDPVPALWSSDWWSEFLRSPGLAGTLAVATAVLGLVGVWLNVAAARRSRERDRWWEMFQRVSGEVETYSDKRATMVLEAMAGEARTGFERQMISSLIDQIVPPDEDQVTAEGAEEGEDEES